MIQRIQTLYLILALALMVLLLVFPAAQVIGEDMQLYQFKITGVYELSGSGPLLDMLYWPLLILVVIIMVIYLIAIFLFKRRRLQMRLCIYNILLLAGILGLMYYYLSFTFKETSAMEYSYKLPFVLPLIAMILTYLAFRAVRKDELLVRSIDRIR
jgi:hypothetical protein